MSSKKHRILYVEDHADTRDLINFVLQRASYDVTTAETMADAVNLAATGSYDLYLLDSRLPDGSGVDLCRRLRQKDSDTPILFFSAAAYELDKHTALESGAQGYLTKPSTDGELCDIIRKLIDARDGSVD